jgi:hypothetical protein
MNQMHFREKTSCQTMQRGMSGARMVTGCTSERSIARAPQLRSRMLFSLPSRFQAVIGPHRSRLELNADFAPRM